MKPEHQEILARLPSLPDSAVVPIAIAAIHDTVSERTVRRTYPLIQLSDRRKGVSVAFLRRRQAQTAA